MFIIFSMNSSGSGCWLKHKYQLNQISKRTVYLEEERLSLTGLGTYIFPFPQFFWSMGEMAVVAFGAVATTLLEMLAELRFVKIRQVLQLFLSLEALWVHRG